MTQKSLDESENMLDQIRSRRSRRREAGSQDESQSQRHQLEDSVSAAVHQLDSRTGYLRHYKQEICFILFVLVLVFM